MRIDGRCALVTGAGSGLGRATARALSEAGAKLVLVDIDAEAGAALAAELGPSRAVAVRADVRDEQQVQVAVAQATAQFGGLHIAVSCAGVPSSRKLISQGAAHELELWNKVVGVNLTGVFNVMRLSAVAMLAHEPEDGERGVIINTASIAAFDGQKGQVAYAASKAGVAGLTLPAARDLAEHAIRCVAIAPGLFKTELFDQIPEKGVAALTRALLHPPRMGEPAEFAAFVRHVIENPYLNGSCLRLDGGARLPS